MIYFVWIVISLFKYLSYNRVVVPTLTLSHNKAPIPVLANAFKPSIAFSQGSGSTFSFLGFLAALAAAFSAAIAYRSLSFFSSCLAIYLCMLFSKAAAAYVSITCLLTISLQQKQRLVDKGVPKIHGILTVKFLLHVEMFFKDLILLLLFLLADQITQLFLLFSSESSSLLLVCSLLVNLLLQTLVPLLTARSFGILLPLRLQHVSTLHLFGHFNTACSLLVFLVFLIRVVVHLILPLSPELV